MYFRKKVSGGRVYLQIAESRRVGGQVHQRVITTLGRLDALQASGQLERLVRSGARFNASGTATPGSGRSTCACAHAHASPRSGSSATATSSAGSDRSVAPVNVAAPCGTLLNPLVNILIAGKTT